MEAYKSAIRVQFLITLLGFILLVIKFYAYFLTRSVAILTDAFESIVNVVAGVITLASLKIAARPRDTSHPYGHGKAEFISAGIEGTLIILAGIIIFYEAGKRIFVPAKIEQLDKGLWLIAIGGLVNLLAGWLAIYTGKKSKSLGITASGKHLLSDALSTVGLIVGLVILYLTGWTWMDSAIAILFGALIIYTGFKIIRSSIAGIMDEADETLMKSMASYLQQNRTENWVDLHNLRVIKFGNRLHVDCHLTLPWFMNLDEAHAELETLGNLITSKYGNRFEMFVHTDGCRPFSCGICSKKNCHARQTEFRGMIEWNTDNLFENRQHEYNNQQWQ